VLLFLSCLSASRLLLLPSRWISFHLGQIPDVGLCCSCTTVLAEGAGMWEKRKGQDFPVQKKCGFKVVSVGYETKLSIVSM